jgi:hypothetical protein
MFFCLRFEQGQTELDRECEREVERERTREAVRAQQEKLDGEEEEEDNTNDDDDEESLIILLIVNKNVITYSGKGRFSASAKAKRESERRARALQRMLDRTADKKRVADVLKERDSGPYICLIYPKKSSLKVGEEFFSVDKFPYY